MIEKILNWKRKYRVDYHQRKGEIVLKNSIASDLAECKYGCAETIPAIILSVSQPEKAQAKIFVSENSKDFFSQFK